MEEQPHQEVSQPHPQPTPEHDHQKAHPPKEKKPYRIMLGISLIILIFCVAILVNNYTTTGDWVKKGQELRGGLAISTKVAEQIDIKALEADLSEKFGLITVKETTGFGGRELIVEGPSTLEYEKVLAELKSKNIPTEKSSIRSISPALGESFFAQIQLGIIISFVLMGIVVFLLFRNFITPVSVILAAGVDIIETLAFMNVFGIELSLASFAALLMLIGYSVDTDILQSTRVFKGTDSMKERFRSSVKTGMTMTLTTIGALAVLFISNLNPILSQIAAVLLIGLVVDMASTWLTNSGILMWYMHRKGSTEV
ncbi:MAG TPA: protein translocase subunit SecF [archaeon]|nr:protein translocase subunit SecF [archaeon]